MHENSINASIIHSSLRTSGMNKNGRHRVWALLDQITQLSSSSHSHLMTIFIYYPSSRDSSALIAVNIPRTSKTAKRVPKCTWSDHLVIA
ncbi:hypothetical protein TNCT_348571 [Trichonephila clavata]|uniref:Uncharacterized protein n=1 Tax=Trichonephila clavata TaxID=2740835 RepID=A0A8X6FEE8_TRICU|nr:hypothetical protein TNCT_348571 [Trichonephila clavata]